MMALQMCVCCCFSHMQLFATLWTVACQPPLSMGFSKQEYWRGSPCPSPGVFPAQGSNPRLLWLLHCRGFFTDKSWGKPEGITGKRPKCKHKFIQGMLHDKPT